MFKFIRGNNITKLPEFRARCTEGVLAHLDIFPADFLLVSKFVDVFKKLSRLPPNMVVVLAIKLILSTAPIPLALYQMDNRDRKSERLVG